MSGLLPPAFCEAFAVHRIFHAAGVPYADIYVIPEAIDWETGERQMAVQARQGGLTFTVTVGKVDFPVEEFAARWADAAEHVRGLSGQAFREMTDATEIRKRAAEILAAMALKGFRHRVSTKESQL